MLYVIGLGLSDEKDITVKGLEVGKNQDPDVNLKSAEHMLDRR